MVLEEWARVGVGSAIPPLSKLSTPTISHPLVFGNGHRATIGFEALWPSSAACAAHLQALTQHLRSAGSMLAHGEPSVGSAALALSR
ncbi:MAG: hypothetical protein ACRDRK_09380 [Pseudonocardia sp.]